MQIKITHLSTACTLLEIGSLSILTDPVFDSGEKRYRLGPGAYATRRIGPALDKANPLMPHAVLLSHTHHLDNLDEAGREFVKDVPCIITGEKSNDLQGQNILRLPCWESTTLTGPDNFTLKVTAVPARHGPWWFPETSHVVGFILQWSEGHPDAIYISGDTVYFRGLKKLSQRFKIRLALLHLGAVHFWPPWPPFLRFTFNGREAAKCARMLAAENIVPIHYERFIWSHFHESLDSYRLAFADEGLSSRVHWLRHGEQTSFDL